MGSPTKQIFKKMKFIIPLIGLYIVFASASTDGKEDHKAVDLAEKLAQAREETKQYVERENTKLRQEDEKIKKDADKIKRTPKSYGRKMKRSRKKIVDYVKKWPSFDGTTRKSRKFNDKKCKRTTTSRWNWRK